MSVGSEIITITVKKKWLYALLGLTVGLSFGFIAGRWSVRALAQQAKAVAQQPRTAASEARGHRQPEVVDVAYRGRPYWGPADAAVVVLEFTDYQCPYCARFFRQTYPQVVAEYGDRVRYVVRNFPLTGIHPYAAKAAEAAECAADQGRFWEYRDILFQRQTALDVPSLKRYGAELGLGEEFEQCLDSGRKTEIVSADLQDGRRYGVRGTPTFFVNGRMLAGAKPFPVVQSLIERAEKDIEDRGSRSR